MKQFVSTIRFADRDEDGLGNYFKDIRKYQPLTATEENLLACDYQQTGNPKSLDKLIKANLRYVAKVAKNYVGCGLSLPDLIEEGNLGLVAAAKTFNYNLGYKFITYATSVIDQHIVHAIQKLGSTIHHPKDMQYLIARINRFKNDFFMNNGFEPDAIDIADGLSVDEKEVRNALYYIDDNCKSIDDPVGDEDDNYGRDILLGDFSTDAALLSEEEKNRIMSYVGKLSEKAQEAITLYYGLNGEESMKIPAISIRINLTPQRVHQIIHAALTQLRKMMEMTQDYRFAA